MKAKYLFLLACIALLGVACSQDPIEDISVAPTSQTHSFCIKGELPDLTTEDNTRASLESVMRLKWAHGDQVSVVNLTTGKQLGGSLTNTADDGTIATFQGDITGTISAGDHLALIYPSQNYTTEADFDYIIYNIDEQSGLSNSVPFGAWTEFDCESPTSLEYTERFYFATGYIRMNLGNLVPGKPIEQVIIKGASPLLAIGYDGDQGFAYGSLPEMISLNFEGDTSVVGASGSKTIFFSVTPSDSVDEPRQIYVKQNGGWKVAEWSKSTLNAGGLYNTTVTNFKDSPIDPTKDIYIEFADPITEEICLSNWDMNRDGKLSKLEAHMVFDLGTAFKSSTITSFEEFKYFTNVREIRQDNFRGCDDLQYIAIPPTVEVIGDFTFAGIGSLQKVDILIDENYESNLQYIGIGAFQETKIHKVVIPPSVEEIHDVAFAGIDELEEVYCMPFTAPRFEGHGWDDLFLYSNNINLYFISEAIESYQASEYWQQYLVRGGFFDASTLLSMSKEAIFSMLYDVDDVVITGRRDEIIFADNAVKQICVEHWDADHDGKFTFFDASLITDISTYFQHNTTITSFDELKYFTRLTEIHNAAFSGCSNLRSVVLPAGIKSIGAGAFGWCRNLSNIVLNEGLESIKDQAFAMCEALTTIRFPQSITTIDPQAFEASHITHFEGKGADDGKALIIDGTLVAFVPQFTNAPYARESYTIPAGVTKIGRGAFWGRNSLFELNIPAKGVYEIDDFAFYQCEYTKINLLVDPTSFSSDLIRIGDHAFEECYFIEKIVIPSSVKTIGAFSFTNCAHLCEIYCTPSTAPYIDNDIEDESRWMFAYNGCDRYDPANTNYIPSCVNLTNPGEANYIDLNQLGYVLYVFHNYYDPGNFGQYYYWNWTYTGNDRDGLNHQVVINFTDNDNIWDCLYKTYYDDI